MSVLTQLFDLRNRLCSSSSVKDRKQVLSSIVSNNNLTSLLKQIYDPDIKFYATSTIAKKHKPRSRSLVSWKLPELLQALSSRKITGHSALDAIVSFVNSLSSTEQEMFWLVLDKDLKASINTKIINSSIPGLIPEFSVALGKDYDPKYTVKGNWCISRKFDGIRCIVIIKDSVVRYYTRLGKEIHSLDNLTPELSQFPDCVLDGEITQNEALEDFQKLMKEIHRKNHQLTNVLFNVFDVLTISEFWQKTSPIKLTDRISRFPIGSWKFVSCVSQIPFTNETLEEYTGKFKEFGWEGLIVRKDADYKGKRSNDILKVKQFFTEEYRVKSVETGMMRVYDPQTKNYTRQNVLTAIRIIHKDVPVRVGSGFSVQERKDFYENPDLIVGKIVSVRYFDETKDGNLRFPTYKGMYGNERGF